MDINLLVANVGNSRIALGVFKAGELIHSHRVAISDQPALRSAVSDAWALIAKTDRPSVAAVSVNPAAATVLNQIIQDTASKSVRYVGKEIEFPIAVRTDEPAKTGADRIVAVAAAFEQLGKCCVVVDAGTALTVNLCDDAGGFVGGAIAPGFSTMLASLSSATAALPSLSPAKPEGDFGTNTQQAMLHGCFHALRGLVREAVENFASSVGTWPEVIATGGDAELLFSGWELIHAVSPDLALYGIALAYTEHEIRHNDGQTAPE